MLNYRLFLTNFPELDGAYSNYVRHERTQNTWAEPARLTSFCLNYTKNMQNEKELWNSQMKNVFIFFSFEGSNFIFTSPRKHIHRIRMQSMFENTHKTKIILKYMKESTCFGYYQWKRKGECFFFAFLFALLFDERFGEPWFQHVFNLDLSKCSTNNTICL